MVNAVDGDLNDRSSAATENRDVSTSSPVKQLPQQSPPPPSLASAPASNNEIILAEGPNGRTSHIVAGNSNAAGTRCGAFVDHKVFATQCGQCLKFYDFTNDNLVQERYFAPLVTATTADKDSKDDSNVRDESAAVSDDEINNNAADLSHTKPGEYLKHRIDCFSCSTHSHIFAYASSRHELDESRIYVHAWPSMERVQRLRDRRNVVIAHLELSTNEYLAAFALAPERCIVVWDVLNVQGVEPQQPGDGGVKLLEIPMPSLSLEPIAFAFSPTCWRDLALITNFEVCLWNIETDAKGRHASRLVTRDLPWQPNLTQLVPPTSVMLSYDMACASFYRPSLAATAEVATTNAEEPENFERKIARGNCHLHPKCMHWATASDVYIGCERGFVVVYDGMKLKCTRHSVMMSTNDVDGGEQQGDGSTRITADITAIAMHTSGVVLGFNDGYIRICELVSEQRRGGAPHGDGAAFGQQQPAIANTNQQNFFVRLTIRPEIDAAHIHPINSLIMNAYHDAIVTQDLLGNLVSIENFNAAAQHQKAALLPGAQQPVTPQPPPSSSTIECRYRQLQHHSRSRLFCDMSGTASRGGVFYTLQYDVLTSHIRQRLRPPQSHSFYVADKPTGAASSAHVHFCCLCAHPYYPVIALGSFDGFVAFFDTTKAISADGHQHAPRLIHSVRLYTGPIEKMKFDPSGEALVVFGRDSTSLPAVKISTAGEQPNATSSTARRVSNCQRIFVLSASTRSDYEVIGYQEISNVIDVHDFDVSNNLSSGDVQVAVAITWYAETLSIVTGGAGSNSAHAAASLTAATNLRKVMQQRDLLLSGSSTTGGSGRLTAASGGSGAITTHTLHRSSMTAFDRRPSTFSTAQTHATTTINPEHILNELPEMPQEPDFLPGLQASLVGSDFRPFLAAELEDDAHRAAAAAAAAAQQKLTSTSTAASVTAPAAAEEKEASSSSSNVGTKADLNLDKFFADLLPPDRQSAAKAVEVVDVDANLAAQSVLRQKSSHLLNQYLAYGITSFSVVPDDMITSTTNTLADSSEFDPDTIVDERECDLNVMDQDNMKIIHDDETACGSAFESAIAHKCKLYGLGLKFAPQHNGVVGIAPLLAAQQHSHYQHQHSQPQQQQQQTYASQIANQQQQQQRPQPLPESNATQAAAAAAAASTVATFVDITPPTSSRRSSMPARFSTMRHFSVTATTANAPAYNNVPTTPAGTTCERPQKLGNESSEQRRWSANAVILFDITREQLQQHDEIHDEYGSFFADEINLQMYGFDTPVMAVTFGGNGSALYATSTSGRLHKLRPPGSAGGSSHNSETTDWFNMEDANAFNGGSVSCGEMPCYATYLHALNIVVVGNAQGVVSGFLPENLHRKWSLPVSDTAVMAVEFNDHARHLLALGLNGTFTMLKVPNISADMALLAADAAIDETAASEDEKTDDDVAPVAPQGNAAIGRQPPQWYGRRLVPPAAVITSELKSLEQISSTESSQNAAVLKPVDDYLKTLMLRFAEMRLKQQQQETEWQQHQQQQQQQQPPKQQLTAEDESSQQQLQPPAVQTAVPKEGARARSKSNASTISTKLPRMSKKVSVASGSLAAGRKQSVAPSTTTDARRYAAENQNTAGKKVGLLLNENAENLDNKNGENSSAAPAPFDDEQCRTWCVERTEQINNNTTSNREQRAIADALADVQRIGDQLARLLDDNNTKATSYEKLESFEFDLDPRRRHAVISQANVELEKLRNSEERAILTSKREYYNLLNKYWHSMAVKACYLYAYGSGSGSGELDKEKLLRVCNFPVPQRNTTQWDDILTQVLTRRKIDRYERKLANEGELAATDQHDTKDRRASKTGEAKPTKQQLQIDQKCDAASNISNASQLAIAAADAGTTDSGIVSPVASLTSLVDESSSLVAEKSVKVGGSQDDVLANTTQPDSTRFIRQLFLELYGKTEPPSSSAAATSSQHSTKDIWDSFYNDLEVITVDKLFEQSVLTMELVFRLKKAFNEKFDKLRRRKHSEQAEMMEEHAKLTEYAQTLRVSKQPCEQPRMQPEEDVETLVTKVTNSEVRRFMLDSGYEVPLQNVESKPPEAAAGGDDWRERGLWDMMFGVLDMKKADQLAKDIAPPAFVGVKAVPEWTEDEQRQVQEWKKKQADLELEREAYKQFQEQEIIRIAAHIDEIKHRFDGDLAHLYQLQLKVEFFIDGLEWKIGELRTRFLLMHSMRYEQNVLNKQQAEQTSTESNMAVVAERLRELASKDGEDLRSLEDEEKIVDKHIRKELVDSATVAGNAQPMVVMEALMKVLRRKPKSIRTGFMPLGNVQQQPAAGGGGGGGGAHGTLNNNPFTKRSCGPKLLQSALAKTRAELKRLEDFQQAPEGCDEPTWTRFCEQRRRKAEYDLHVAYRRAEHDDTLAVAARYARIAQYERHQLQHITKRRNMWERKLAHYARNAPVFLTVRNEIVEIDQRPFEPYQPNNCLIQAELLRELNKQLIMQGASRLQALQETLKYASRIAKNEKLSQICINEIKRLLYDMRRIAKLKISRPIQSAIHQGIKHAGQIPELRQSFTDAERLTERRNRHRVEQTRAQQLNVLKHKMNVSSKEMQKAQETAADLLANVSELKDISDTLAAYEPKLLSRYRYNRIKKKAAVQRRLDRGEAEMAALRGKLAAMHRRTFCLMPKKRAKDADV